MQGRAPAVSRPLDGLRGGRGGELGGAARPPWSPFSSHLLTARDEGLRAVGHAVLVHVGRPRPAAVPAQEDGGPDRGDRGAREHRDLGAGRDGLSSNDSSAMSSDTVKPIPASRPTGTRSRMPTPSGSRKRELRVASVTAPRIPVALPTTSPRTTAGTTDWASGDCPPADRTTVTPAVKKANSGVVVVTQVATVAGAGAWFPWAAPGTWAGMDSRAAAAAVTPLRRECDASRRRCRTPRPAEGSGP